MDFLSILLIALALAVDAFAVAMAAGVSLCQVSGRQVFRLSFHFGLFQAMMNVLGWGGGLTIRQLIENVDHWIAFILLAAVAGKMLYDGIRGHEEEERPVDPTRGWTLLVLSVATSIDSLAVGLSFSILNISILLPALIIGVTATIMTMVGLKIGCVAGRASRLGSRAEILGALVLFGIGVNILHTHGIF